MGGTVEQNREVVRDFLQGFTVQGVTAAVESCFADSGTWTVTGSLVVSRTYSKADFIKGLPSLMGKFTAFRITILGMVAEGDFVAVEAQSRGDLPDGRVYANPYHFLFEVRDGEIQAAREYGDTLQAQELLFA